MSEPEIYQLDNGMRVVYKHVTSVVAHLGVMIKAGSKYERESELGLAHFLEHCVFKGTKNRRAFHILSRLDSVGGELNAYTTKEDICVYGSFTSEHFKRTSELLSDILFNSTFPEKEIEKEKVVVIDEINSYLDSPTDKIFDDFETYLYPDHPFGNNILGTIESVQSFTKKDLQDYLDRYLFPENMVISFVGNLKPDFILKYLNKHFGGLSKSEKLSKIASPSTLEPFNIIVPEGNYQTHIMIGGRAPSFYDEDRSAFSLLVNILGGPALNSRLLLGIREKYGYTYSIESNFTAFEETGYWNVYAGTDEQYKKKTIKLIKKELNKFIKEPLSDSQLKMSVQQIKGQLALSMDNNTNLMLMFAKNLLVYDKIDTLVEVYAKLDKITPEDISEVAKKYFDNSTISELIFTT